MESSQTLITITLKKQIQDYDNQIVNNFFSKGPNLELPEDVIKDTKSYKKIWMMRTKMMIVAAIWVSYIKEE